MHLGLVVTIALPAWSQSVTVVTSADRILTPQHFGAKGDGTTDDTTALQNWATAAGTHKLWPSGTYKVTGQITFSGNLVLDCQNVTVDASSVTTDPFANDTVILFGQVHTLGAVKTLSAVANRGDFTLTFAVDPGFAEGDVILITDTAADTWIPGEKLGELARVERTGTTVNLYGPLYGDTYPTATTEVRVVPMDRVIVRGSLTVKGPAAGGTVPVDMSAVHWRQCVDSSADGLRTIGEAEVGMYVRECYNFSGRNLEIRSASTATANSQYGVNVISSQSVRLHGQFTARRHAIAVTGFTLGGGAVQTRDLQCHGTFEKSSTDTGWAVDCHGPSEFCQFTGVIRGGVGLAGDNQKVQADIWSTNLGVCIDARPDECKGWNFDFSGCRLYSRVSGTRPVVDWGGFSIGPDEDTTRGGTLRLNDMIVDATGANYAYIIDVLNRDSDPGTDDPIIVDLRGTVITRSHASATHAARVTTNQVTAATPIQALLIDGFYIADRDLPIEIVNTAGEETQSVHGSGSGISGPTALAATETDYKPSCRGVWRLTATGPQTIQGIHPGADVTIVNVDTTPDTITIANENAGATARNRIITGTGSDIALGQNDSVTLRYDGTQQRWRVVASQ